MNPLTYGLCPSCRNWYALRPSGVLRGHRMDGRVRCAGSGKGPDVDETEVVIQARATRQPMGLGEAG